MAASPLAHLRVVGAAQHVVRFLQALEVFFFSNDELKHADSGAFFSIPVLGSWIQPLEHVKCFQAEIKGAGLVAVVGNYLQQQEAVGHIIHAEVHLPRLLRLADVYQALARPADAVEVHEIRRVLNRRQLNDSLGEPDQMLQ